MVDNVIGINGKPFDARDFDEENRKAVEKMLFDLADDIDTGAIIPRGFALALVQESGEPVFWFGGKESDMFMLYGSIEAMRQTFWESVIKEGQHDYGE